MPEPLRGKDQFQNQIRHPTETKITKETQSQDLRNPANSDALDESEIVHLGKNFQNECSLFIQTGKKSHKHCGTLEHANVLYHWKVTKPSLTNTKLNCFQAITGSRQQMAQ